MSLEPISKSFSNQPTSKTNVMSKVMEDTKNLINIQYGIEVSIKIKSPHTIILSTSSASAVSNLFIQKEKVLDSINNIYIDNNLEKLDNIVFKQT